ncbi:MAG: TIGR02302 family protein [Rhodobacteraceae bacterium]|nr:TIGR02302 family protein [Paracoccaceae bacterium]
MAKKARIDETERRIERVLRATRAAMVLESALQAFWPFLAILAGLWAALAFGAAELGNRLQVGLALFAAAALLLRFLWRGARRFLWPSRAAAIARLDASLPGRPLAALDDAPALGGEDPAVRALWSVHQARMLARAAKAERVPADLRLASRDPWALRLAVLVFFGAALIFAGSSGVESLRTAMAPGAGAAPKTGPSYEGWAEPPAYTGRATLYLPELAGGDAPVSLPKGTRITLRTYGDETQFRLSESVSGVEGTGFTRAADGIALAEFDLAQSGEIRLRRGGRDLGHWSFAIEPDLPPEIAVAGPVERAPGGLARIPYLARDDHGITAARAEIALDLPAVDRRYGLALTPDPRDRIVIPLPLPVSGSAAEVSETLEEDFSGHPWAGLPVTITLVAEDALGQTGRSETVHAALPGRKFFDPAAAALAEQRRDLLWAAANGSRVSQVLRAVTFHPEGLFDRAGAYLMTRIAIRRLEAAVEADQVAAARDDIAAGLWRAALLLEDGSLGDAADRLARAKERLSEALKGDATDEEIAELMQELRDATRDYMEQMAREAIERGEMETAEAPQEGQSLNQDQLQELMDRIQELSEQGRRAEAEALLEMLQQMLENMEMRLTQGGEGGSQGEQSMQGLSDALREQQGLADDSFRELQREFREGSGQPGAEGETQGAPRGEGRAQGEGTDPGSLAERQEALRELMDELQQNLPGEADSETRQALEDAQRSMEDARDGLRDGNTAEALNDQADAIDQLREGMRGLSEDMRQAEGEQGGEDSEGGTSQSRSNADPLGRPLGAMGGARTDSRMLPEGSGSAAARAREILDEIRRRSGDRSRPQVELDYLRRLLDRF